MSYRPVHANNIQSYRNNSLRQVTNMKSKAYYKPRRSMMGFPQRSAAGTGNGLEECPEKYRFRTAYPIYPYPVLQDPLSLLPLLHGIGK